MVEASSPLRKEKWKDNHEQIDPVAVTGEVIYESIHRTINKKILKAFVQQSIERRLSEIHVPLVWASYLVIFSPGQEYEEVRCQVDIETNCGWVGFSVGYGQRPNHAFNDAVERMQWFEKNASIRMIV